jgi:hypothetical protein
VWRRRACPGELFAQLDQLVLLGRIGTEYMFGNAVVANLSFWLPAPNPAQGTQIALFNA